MLTTVRRARPQSGLDRVTLTRTLSLGDIVRLQPNLVRSCWVYSDRVIKFEGAAPLCKPACVHRDIQRQEQVGQGHCRISRVRHAGVIGLLD